MKYAMPGIFAPEAIQNRPSCIYYTGDRSKPNGKSDETGLRYT